MIKKRLVVASNNEHKIKELKEILKDFPFEILTMKEVGLDIEIEETGTTFLENAYIKAKTVFDLLEDTIVLSDDSGLSVDELDGAPGVYSARFAGPHGDSRKNNEKLLRLMKDKAFEDRKARFICAIVLIIDKQMEIKVEGQVEGYITEELSGEEGFGYDPLFYVPSFNKTFAQMSSEDKNTISHRGRALKKLREKLDLYSFGD